MARVRAPLHARSRSSRNLDRPCSGPWLRNPEWREASRAWTGRWLSNASRLSSQVLVCTTGEDQRCRRRARPTSRPADASRASRRFCSSQRPSHHRRAFRPAGWRRHGRWRGWRRGRLHGLESKGDLLPLSARRLSRSGSLARIQTPESPPWPVPRRGAREFSWARSPTTFPLTVDLGARRGARRPGPRQSPVALSPGSARERRGAGEPRHRASGGQTLREVAFGIQPVAEVDLHQTRAAQPCAACCPTHAPSGAADMPGGPSAAAVDRAPA